MIETRVAVTDIDEKAIAALRDSDPDILTHNADVTDETALAIAIDDTAQAFGGLDVVCANAGIRFPGHVTNGWLQSKQPLTGKYVFQDFLYQRQPPGPLIQ